MNKQSEFKHNWILNTLDRLPSAKGADITPEIIQAVFNIPLNDAKVIIQQWERVKK